MGVRAMVNLQNFGIAIVLLYATYYVNNFLRRRKARRLGAVPLLLRSWIPFTLDIPYKAVKNAWENRTLDLWQETFAKVGCNKTGSYTFQCNVLSTDIVLTADPDNIKALLATQFHDFGKGEQFHKEWKEFLGDSIFNVDGQTWHDSRQLIRPMFMRERVADLDLVEEHVAKLLSMMGNGDGAMILFDKLISRYTLDAATHFLFGHSAGTLDDEEAMFGRAFGEVQRVQSILSYVGPLRHVWPKKSFRDGLRTMDEFIDPWITETLELSPDELESKLSKSDTFIHALARYTRDRKVIRDQLVSLLLAGRDTTAATLSWLFLELARNPHVVTTLRSEISDVVGNKRPTYENIKDMKYLTSVVNETLRLYPAVPFNVRSALKDTTLPHGGGPDGMSPIGVLKGTVVAYSPLFMQRNPSLYPSHSEVFPYHPLTWVPERWATWTPKAWHYLPFNGGPRICIGQQFAMAEMGYTIIRILQEFESIVDYGNKEILKTAILLTPAEGVKVGFVKTPQRLTKGQ